MAGSRIPVTNIGRISLRFVAKPAGHCHGWHTPFENARKTTQGLAAIRKDPIIIAICSRLSSQSATHSCGW